MKKRIMAILAVLVILCGIFVPDIYAAVSAEEKKAFSVVDLDKTTITEDLGNNLSAYLDEDTSETDVTLISLQEYCYSPKYPSNADEVVYGDEYYNVYLYFHNPNEYALESKADDSVQISGYEYFIQYLDKTSDGLYYKYKVIYKSDLYNRITAYSYLHSGAREYVVEKMSFKVAPNATYLYDNLSLTYTFDGYASGFGGDSTRLIQCVMEGSETLHLDVTPTQYRPAGTNGKNNYTRDMLHSVYFSVPNSYLETYGEMYEVHAEWHNAVTAPALVTGNQTAYNAITPYLGQNIGKYTDSLPYIYLGHVGGISQGGDHRIFYDFGYNIPDVIFWGGTSFDYVPVVYNKSYYISPLYLMFNSGSGANSADTYIVSSATIKQALQNGAYGGDKVLNRYYRCFFDSVDTSKTEVRITKNYNFPITDMKVSQTWWEKFLGTSHIEYSNFYNNIYGIKQISASDLSGNTSEVAQRLYMDENDVAGLRTAFMETNSTVFLFRFQISDYISQEATLYNVGSFLGGTTLSEVDTNAYFFQETVNLDFDILDVTFTKNGRYTVIPVAMDPIDIIPAAIPPVPRSSCPTPPTAPTPPRRPCAASRS